MKNITRKGFTLLEILLVITLLSIIMIILIREINPNRILSGIQDNQREADALKIYQAIEEYALKNNSYPEVIKNLSDNNSLYICKTSAPNCNNTNQINLSSILVPTYLSKIPEYSTDNNNSGFYVVKDANGKIGIGGVRQLDETTFVKGLESQSFVTAPTTPKLAVTSCTYANKKISIPYTAGEVGYNYASQTINSTGVTGLTATSLGDGPLATGGTVIDSGGFRYHVFTSSGTFNVTTTSQMTVVLVGGGGGGGGGHANAGAGAGAGAGGKLVTLSESIPSGSFNIVVGDAGGGGANGVAGNNGQASTGFSYTATGGQGGGSGWIGDSRNGQGGTTGGSAGGASGLAGSQGGANGGGWDDGAGVLNSFIGNSAGGADVGGIYSGGGGGGGVTVSLSSVAAINGTIGSNAVNYYTENAGPGGAGYGAGGGGASGPNAGGAGAKGIVIVRYQLATGGNLATSGLLEYAVTGTPGGVGNANFDLSNIGNMGVGCNNSNIAVNVTGSLATGGTVTDITVGADTYRVHTFTTVGTSSLNVIQGGELEYLVVGGGGAGGPTYHGAGGGAGGYRSSVIGEMSGGGSMAEPSLTINSGSYQVTVGAGGIGGVNNGNGVNSTFSNIIALGGGGGNGRNGGSGSGTSYGTPSVGLGTVNQGYNGGTGVLTSAPPNYGSGGGGGAGGVGQTGTSTSGGNGGIGLTSSINGTPMTRAGGGGGSTYNGGTPGQGIAGGGNGSSGQGTSAALNSGSGGGGSERSVGIIQGGSGGSGIVIVRYKLLDY